MVGVLFVVVFSVGYGLLQFVFLSLRSLVCWFWPASSCCSSCSGRVVVSQLYFFSPLLVIIWQSTCRPFKKKRSRFNYTPALVFIFGQSIQNEAIG